MATYNYTIKSPSGREVTFDSDREIDEKDANEVLAMDAQAGTDALASFTGKGKDKAAERSELKKNISRSLGISDDQFDENKGADAGTRALAALLPTSGEKVNVLQKKFGQNNVKPLRIGGKDRIAYRDDQDGKFRLFDEQGFSLKDITSDWAGEVVPLAASVIAGTAAATATAFSGGLAAPLAIGAAAGAAQAATGFMQDVAVRALTGQEQQYGEAAKRRAKEGVFTAGADAITAGFARPIARMWGDRAVNAGAEKISKLMAKYGGDFDTLPASVRGTGEEAASALKRAAALPNAREARGLSSVRDRLPQSIDDLRSQYGGSADDTIRYVSGVKAKADDMVAQARRAELEFTSAERGLRQAKGSAKEQFRDATTAAKKQAVNDRLQAAEAMRGQIDNQLEKIVKGRQARAVSGEELRTLRLEGQRLAELRVGGLYEEAYRRANVANAETNPMEVSNMIGDTLKRAGYELDDVGQISGKTLETMKETFGDKLGRIYNNFLKRGMTRGVESMQFSELDQYVREIGSSVNWKKFSSKSTNADERAFKKFYDDMVKLRDRKLKDAGQPAFNKYNEASLAYKKEVRPYVDDANLASSGEEITKGEGNYTQASERVTDNALGSNQAAERAIKHSSNPDITRKVLQRQFMSKILPRQVGNTRKQINLSADDTQMLKTLFGTGDKGWTSERGSVNALNKLISKYGDLSEKLSTDELASFVARKTVKEQGILEKALEKKLSKQAAEKKFLNDKLVKMVNDRSIEMPADINMLADDVMSSAKTPSEMREFMGRFKDEKAREGFQRSTFDNLLNKSGWDSVASQRSVKGDKALWEPAAMERILRRGADGQPATNEGRKYLEVLGEEAFERLELFNELLTRSAKLTKDNGGSIGRLVSTFSADTGVPRLLVVSAAPFTAVGKRLMGVLHTSELLEPYLRSFSNPKSINPKALKNVMASLLSTQKGMTDLQDEASRDPEFSQWVSEYYNTVYIPERGQQGSQ